MAKEESSKFFPQGFLIYQQAYGSQRGILASSSLGSNGNQYNKVAKLKGSYQPETVVSKLVNTDGVRVDNYLLNLDNHKISALVPEIRLFRVLEDQNKIIPFYFPVASEFDMTNGVLDLEKSSFSAGAAVIETFSYTLTGRNPYQIGRKFLNANLKIKVDNLSVLFSQKEKFALLADLFTIRANSRNTAFPNSDKTHSPGALAAGTSCRIIATLGYSVPRNYNMFTSEEITTIEQTKQVINLYYSAHDLQVSQDGSTTVSVKYTGYLEAVKEDSNFDFLSNSATKSFASRRAAKKEKTAGNIKKIFNKKDEKNKKANKADKEEQKRKKTEDTAEAFGLMISDLYERGKIYPMSFTSEDFEPYFSSEEAEADDVPTEPADPSVQPNVGVESFFGVFQEHVFHYFTFGDMLDSYFKKLGRDLDSAISRNKKKMEESGESNDKIAAAIRLSAKAKKDLKLINILLCDIQVKTKKETSRGSSFYKNIADVPISLDNFYTKIWTEIRKADLGYYDMNSFLKFSLGLLNQSLSELSDAPIVEDVKYKMATFTSRDLVKKINRGVLKLDDAPKSTDSFSKNSKLSEYVLFMQEPAAYSKSPGSGNRNTDTKNGLFHLRPNKDRGFLKNITFSKINQPAREASLVVGSSNLYDELRIPHNANATMYGNFMFLPGSQVFVDPNTLGFGSVKDLNSAARRLGFGGYYTVEKVSTTFTNGKLETTLNLLFNAFPETAAEATLSAQAYKSIKKVTSMMAREGDTE